MGRVSSASAHAGPAAERLRSMASGSRHRSAVVAGRGLSRRVAKRRRTTLPRVVSPRRRLSRRSPARARVAPGKWLAPCGQDMDSVARNHLARLRPGGEPAPKSLSPKGAGTPVASRPKCSVPSPVLVLERLALKLPERPHRRRYPAQREADDEAGRVVDREAEPAAVDLPHSPEGLREESVLEGSRPSTWRARCRPA